MDSRDTPARSLETDGSQSSKPKRMRKSRSRGLRTRTGCLTCRSRHKKCDENLPTCGPCSIASRACVYSEEASRNPAAPRQYSQASSIDPSLSAGSASGLALPERRESISNPFHMLAEAASSSPHPPRPVPAPASIPASSPHAGPPAPSLMTIAESYQYARSPDTVASEQLTADMASNRWLDLLATDAAQADANFSLAPSPAPFEEDSSSSASHTHAESRPIGTENQPIAGGDVTTTVPSLVGTFERHAWSLDQDIKLTSEEAYLFRVFAERASQWKHFSTHAIRLALRNVGLSKAILALCARHRATSLQTAGHAVVAHPSSSESDPSSMAVQYYYETLHYLQIALQYESYTHSEELLATARKTSLPVPSSSLVISTYEMLDSSKSNWKRHLKGVFWIQRSQNVNGVSGGLRQSVWWAWLRQDIWAAFRERRRCFSFWRPLVDYPDLTQDELANRIVYLLSQTVNYCAKSDSGSGSSGSGDNSAQKRAYLGEALLSELERWKMHLGPSFQPLPTAAVDLQSVFAPIWIHPPRFAVSMQIYNFIRILITLHRPVVSSGFDGYLKTQKILHEAVNTICGIAMELRDEGSQIMSAQCLFGVPRQAQNHDLCAPVADTWWAILSLIDACEARTGWPMAALRDDLMAEWARVS
ncbi:fungal transcriptional regulatory protein [Apiospora hydei]|uniref:Fungal transcriptional regulatory protein n=1 Tax=Apiospora hydei TaxID=1337664 RepID=A0ABR1UUY9_9PEZI